MLYGNSRKTVAMTRFFGSWLYAEWWIEDWKILGKAVR
jgi:hypothetical protein